MVERIFERLGRRPRIVPVPLGVLTIGLTILHRFKRTPYSPELFRRMNQDLAFTTPRSTNIPKSLSTDSSSNSVSVFSTRSACPGAS